MTSVDHQLKLAAATPVPSAQEPIQYWHGDGDSGGRNCDKPVREHHRPEV